MHIPWIESEMTKISILAFSTSIADTVFLFQKLHNLFSWGFGHISSLVSYHDDLFPNAVNWSRQSENNDSICASIPRARRRLKNSLDVFPQGHFHLDCSFMTFWRPKRWIQEKKNSHFSPWQRRLKSLILFLHSSSNSKTWRIEKEGAFLPKSLYFWRLSHRP